MLWDLSKANTFPDLKHKHGCSCMLRGSCTPLGPAQHSGHR